MSDVVIRVENLSKSYRLGETGGGSLREDLNRWWARRRGKADPLLKVGYGGVVVGPDATFWALRDVSFDVREGEVLGIIGRNGAGKSTLLKILSRITAPSSGRVKIRGRIASLLEVGTGFHPELSGRENIYLNGAILGMKKAEISRRLDEIVDFSEVEPFLDTPVKRYSSGMYVRLAFAVAAHLDPEILIVDEVLAVGDAAFQKKCLGKMDHVSKRQGRTILLVSHNMAMISSLCGRGLLLSHGRTRSHGSASEVILRYAHGGEAPSPIVDYCSANRPVGNAIAQLLEAAVCDSNGEPVGEVGVNEPLSIRMDFRITLAVNYRLAPSFHFHRSDGTCAFVAGPPAVVFSPGSYRAECHIPANLLNDGPYSVTLILCTVAADEFCFFEKGALLFNVRDPLDEITRGGDYHGLIIGAVRPTLRWTVRPL